MDNNPRKYLIFQFPNTPLGVQSLRYWWALTDDLRQCDNLKYEIHTTKVPRYTIDGDITFDKAVKLVFGTEQDYLMFFLRFGEHDFLKHSPFRKERLVEKLPNY